MEKRGCFINKRACFMEKQGCFMEKQPAIIKKQAAIFLFCRLIFFESTTLFDKIEGFRQINRAQTIQKHSY